jgi:hypothetical protein
VITGHAWRPPLGSNAHIAEPDIAKRPCKYTGCGRPKSEHERAVGDQRPDATDGDA